MTGLPALGLEYSAVTGKGYRLARPLELLSKPEISAFLDRHAALRISAVEIHDRIDSTNSHLMACARRGAASGLISLAEHQTAGRGRRGRRWVSPYGGNLYCSVLWRFRDCGLAGLSGLSLAAGVAVIRALRRVGVTEAGLKWPNDLISRERKLGGILVEAAGESDGPCFAVVGLGLNLRLSEREGLDIDQPWIDLAALAGADAVSRNKLAGLVLSELVRALSDFEAHGVKVFLDEWRKHDRLYGREGVLLLSDRQIYGILAGIDDNGLLILQGADGRRQLFASGEISVRTV